VWRWDQQEPFGDNVADQNPSGLGSFDLPLRLPGQYYDAESGLQQNNNREYTPIDGRYVESDPIGITGSLNTYAYVDSSPLRSIDPTGLQGSEVFSERPKAPLIWPNISQQARQRAARQLQQWWNNRGNQSWSQPSSSSSSTGVCKAGDNDECEALPRIDTATCNGIARVRGRRPGAICHASASQRYAECLRNGLSGVRTPLATWNN